MWHLPCLFQPPFQSLAHPPHCSSMTIGKHTLEKCQTMLSYLFILLLLIVRLWPSPYSSLLNEPVFGEPRYDDVMTRMKHFERFSFAGHLTEAAVRFWLPINFSVGQWAEQSRAEQSKGQQSRTLSRAEQWADRAAAAWSQMDKMCCPASRNVSRAFLLI